MTRLVRAAVVAAALSLAVAACGPGRNAPGPGASGPSASGPQGGSTQAEPPPPPEPADAPPLTAQPAGRLVPVGGAPEGVAADPVTGLVAVGLRDPDRVALVDGRTGTVVKEVALPESPRHLDLAAPGGPVLVPAERSNSLAQVSLPDGAVLSNTPVGRFPHNAAAGAGRVFVVNEFGSTMSVIEDGRVIETVPTPLQPGGVAVTPSGLVGVIGVRGLALQVYDAKTLRPVGLLDAGAGPTHVVADLENRFFVADTRGGAILVYATDPQPVMLARVPTPGGAPYGIAFDARRGHLWVTLTALNQVVEYAAQGGTLRQLAVYPTVRQANSVAVDPASGRVFVAGATDGTLQILDPEILRAA